MDEAIRLSLNQDNQTYLDNQLIQEQQQLFDQSEKDYIDQIIQMTVLQESLPKNENMFLNLQDEDSDDITSPKSEQQNEQLLMFQEDHQIDQINKNTQSRDDRQSPLPPS